MGRPVIGILAVLLAAAAAEGQPDSRSVLGERHPELAAGAAAIRAGRYDEGIALTARGLDAQSMTPHVRAAALANLCAAHAANGDPDPAISYCDASLAIDPRNWRAYSNRSYAYWLKGMYARAAEDIEAAAALAPDAREVRLIRGLINEKTLQPQVTMENRQ